MSREKNRYQPNTQDGDRLIMNHDILRKAIEYWGYNSQLNKAQEECAELIMAICKYDTANIIEETADVLIMCEQIKMMYGEERVNDMIEYKLKRLERRML